MNSQIYAYLSVEETSRLGSNEPYRENLIIASGQVWTKFYIERYRKTLLLLQYLFIHKG